MIQVIGKTGMLGEQVVSIANDMSISVYDSYVDITSVNVNDIHADIVINCSGISSDPSGKDKMHSVNQIGPKNLAKACDEVGSRLVHISTDAVFNNPGPHSERDYCSPSTAYGRTKMKGEIRHNQHLTIRTSFIGIGRRGVVSQLLYTCDPIRASTMFLWSGHTVSTIASVMINLALDKNITGLIHVPGEFQNRYEMLNKLVDLFDLDRNRIIRDDSYITDRRLTSLRWRSIGLPDPPAFEVQLAELSDQYRNTCRPKTASPTVDDGDMGEHTKPVTTT